MARRGDTSAWCGQRDGVVMRKRAQFALLVLGDNGEDVVTVKGREAMRAGQGRWGVGTCSTQGTG